jgi:hypothetical protein
MYQRGRYSEAVNRRRTNNTMPKIKRIKGHTTIYKTLSRKLKIEELEPNKNGRLGRVRIHEFTLPPKCDFPQSRKIG